MILAGGLWLTAAAVLSGAPPARVAIDRVPLPAVFAAKLPDLQHVEDPPWPKTSPPRHYVEWKLCTADASMFDRFERALTAAPRSKEPLEILSTYSRLLPECCPAACATLEARRKAATGALKKIYASTELECEPC